MEGNSKSSLPVNNKIEKAIIIGSGPAGLTAAIYAARAGLSPVLIAGLDLGGQAALTDVIENYPGFPDGVQGSQLGELFQRQAERFGAQVAYETVTDIDLHQYPFMVKTDAQDYATLSLIISTGAGSNHLNIPGENEFRGRGVSYCATCDGWFYRGKKTIVVGGGDSALEEAIFLTRFASEVTIVHRRDSLRAGATLQKRAFENPKIRLVWNTVLTEIAGKDVVEKVKTRKTQNGEEGYLETDGVFVFIGNTPNTKLFKDQIALDENGYIAIDPLMRTNVDGVFAAGEVADPYYRQVVTSAGMGAAAAIQAVRFLEDKECEH